MRGNLKRHYTYDSFASEVPSNAPVQEKEVRALRMTGMQLLVSWLSSAVIMLVVFVMGIYSGRAQGVKMALSEQGREAVRMPLAHAVVPAENSNPIKFDSAPFAKVLELGQKQQVAANPEATAEVKYDFSNSVVSAPKQQPVAEKIVPVQIGTLPKTNLNETIEKKQIPASSNSKETGRFAKQEVKAGNFYVQLGIHRSRELAIGLVRKLGQSQMKAKLQEVEMNETLYYRVMMGPFPSKASAEEQRKKVDSARLFDGEIFIREL